MTSAIETQNSTEELPIVSIIIPSYNQGEFIERTLLSVIKQSYPNIEIIVADGGSKDQTVKILERYSREYSNITWFSEKDEGYADAVNKGLKLAKGSIIGIQSSDDYYNKDAIGEAVEILNMYKNASLASGKHIRIDKNGKEIIRTGNHGSRWIDIWDILGYRIIPLQDATFVRKTEIDRVGGLNKEVDFCADVDLWIRILAKRKGIFSNRIWSFRQEHEEQRGSVAVVTFANDCGKSIELLLNSKYFPKNLIPYKKYIKAFQYLWQSTYFERNGDNNTAKQCLLKAINEDPRIYGVNKFREIYNKMNNFTKFEKLSIKCKTITNNFTSIPNRYIFLDDQFKHNFIFNSSNVETLWYLK